MLYTQRFTIEGARQKLKTERGAIANITADAQSAVHQPEPKELPNPDTLKGKQLSTVLDSVRNDLSSLVNLCEIHSKEHK